MPFRVKHDIVVSVKEAEWICEVGAVISLRR